MSTNGQTAPSRFVLTPHHSTPPDLADPAVYYAHLAGIRARAHDPSRDRDDDSTSGGLSSALGKMTLESSVTTTLKPLHANLVGMMWWI